MVEKKKAGLSDPVEEQPFAWSKDLQQKLARLTVKQHRGIERIVVAEQYGVPKTRLLKRFDSCLWCGRQIQPVGRLAGHEAGCSRRGRPWRFVVSQPIYYLKWMKKPLFRDCLEQARLELSRYILDEAIQILHVAAPVAARELRAQVEGADRPLDRRQAAIAILDRRTWKRETDEVTIPEQLSSWLEELREAGDG